MDAQLSEPGRFRAAGELTSVDRLREVFRISGIDEFRALLANEPMLVLPECPDNKLTVEEFFWRDEYFNSQGPDSLQLSVQSGADPALSERQGGI
jgi:hypothetical protein